MPVIGRTCKRTLLLALCLCLLGSCSRKDVSPAASASEPTPEQAAQIESEYVLPINTAASSATANPSPAPPLPNAPQPARPVRERLQGAIHAKLTVQLRMFIEKNGRVPESFSEFANTAMDSAPLAPDGMKFVIDAADRTVKAVKK